MFISYTRCFVLYMYRALIYITCLSIYQSMWFQDDCDCYFNDTLLNWEDVRLSFYLCVFNYLTTYDICIYIYIYGVSRWFCSQIFAHLCVCNHLYLSNFLFQEFTSCVPCDVIVPGQPQPSPLRRQRGRSLILRYIDR